MSGFDTVTKDIPIPEIRRGRKSVHRFDKLDEINKSDFFPASPQSIHSCLALFKKNHQPTWKFKVQKERKGKKWGVRVWRVE